MLTVQMVGLLKDCVACLLELVTVEETDVVLVLQLTVKARERGDMRM